MIKVDESDETQMDVRERNFSKEMVLRVSLYALDRPSSRVDLLNYPFLIERLSPSEILLVLI